jgi:NADPH:quinone reductase-like Zn-dependent oxidoreductase
MSRSVRIHAFGGPEVLRFEDMAIGEPGPGQVRLRIKAIGINRREVDLRAGYLPVNPPLPSVIGFEAAGEIDALGPGIKGFDVGDRVALVPTYSATQYGLYGQASLAPVRSLVAVPDSVSFEEAAATWVAFGTAWAGLIGVGKLCAGQTVLITAPSSSVGLASIQIANRVGARPIALPRSSNKADALRALGAAEVVPARAQGPIDLVDEVYRLTDGLGADLVFDPVGGRGFARLVRATAPGGLLVVYGALELEPTVAPRPLIIARDLTIRGVALPTLANHDDKRAALKSFVREGLEDGSLEPVIARTFPLDQIAEAHRFVEAGEHVGKVVVTV